MVSLVKKGEPPWPDLAELYTAENCLSYRQGSFALIEGDLGLYDLSLPDSSCFQTELRSAFSFRKELISFKKAFLLLYQQSLRVEKSLRQAADFLYVDHAAAAQPTKKREEEWNADNGDYSQVSQLLQEAKGLSTALQEVRDLGKWACLLPRHPELARPVRLSLLLERSTLLSAAAHTERVAREAGVDSDSEGGAREQGKHAALSDEKVLLEPLRQFMLRLAREGPEGWRGHSESASARRRVLRQSLLARGAAKALSIVREVRGLVDFFSVVAAPRLRAAAAAAAKAETATKARADMCTCSSTEFPLRALALRCAKHQRIASTCATVAAAVGSALAGMLRRHCGVDVDGEVEGKAAAATTTAAAAAAKTTTTTGVGGEGGGGGRPSTDVFWAGGDGLGAETGSGSSVFAPHSFAPTALLSSLRRRAGEFREKMLAAVAAEGWPPPPSAGRVRVVVKPTKRKRIEGEAEEEGKGTVKGKRKKAQQRQPFVCWRCGIESNKVWAPRGACFKCEIDLRRALRCPYSERCRKRQDKIAAAAAAAAAAEAAGAAEEATPAARVAPPRPEIHHNEDEESRVGAQAGVQGGGGTTCSGSFCPHSLRCFVCDAFSCRRCALTRGDGDDVAALVEEFSASLKVLFLDFDRTLCSTRSGANPLGGGGGGGGGGAKGKQKESKSSKGRGKRPAAADTALLALASSTSFKTVVVTRNPHSREIKEYLTGLGAVDVSVRAIADEPDPRSATKSSIIEDELGKLGIDTTAKSQSPLCIFADDDVAEVCDWRIDRLGKVGILYRVLFAR